MKKNLTSLAKYPKIVAVSFVLCLLFANTTKAQSSWVWAKSGAGNSAGDGVLVGTDANDNVYITGNYISSFTLGSFVLTSNGGTSFFNFFVIKLDPAGNVLWAHTSVCSNDCTANGMCVDAAGNVYIGGDFDASWASNGTVTFGSTTLTSNGDYNGFLVKYNTSGNVDWAIGLGGPKNQVQGVAVDATGHVFFSGIYTDNSCTVGNITLSPDGNNDSFVAELDSNGTALWATRAAGTSWDDVYGIGVDGSGNVYISGYSGSPSITFGTVTISNTPYAIFLAKFNGSGTCQWATNTISTHNIGNGVNWNTATAVDANGNSYLTGYVGSDIDFGNSVTLSPIAYDYFLVKYNTSGTAVWAQMLPDSIAATGFGVATDVNGNIYTSGYFDSHTATFGSKTITSNEVSTSFVVEYDPNGNVILALHPVGNVEEGGEGIAVDASGNILLSGSGESTVLVFGSDTISLNNENDPFVAKYGVVANHPVANFTGGNTVVCAGSTVNFTDQSTGSPLSWNWTFPGGTPDTSTLQNPLITYRDSGTYNVKLVVGNSGGTDSLIKTGYITVIATPVIGLISAKPDTVCAGNTSQLTASGSWGTLQWQSSVAGSNYTNLSDADSAVYNTPPLSQTTGYRLVANNGSCADTSAALSLLVNPLPSPPALYTNDSLICSSDSSLITTSGSYSSYLWNDGDTRPFTYVYTAGGYWLTVTDANGCSAVSGHKNISVYPVPSVSLTVLGDTLTALYANAYQWYLNDTLIPGATSPVYVAHKTGDYLVQITDSNGCTAQSAEQHIVITGISDLLLNGLPTIYPDPFTNTLFITAGDLNGMEIYDANGRLVFSTKINNTDTAPLSIDASKFDAGIYCIKIMTETNCYTRKAIKL